MYPAEYLERALEIVRVEHGSVSHASKVTVMDEMMCATLELTWPSSLGLGSQMQSHCPTLGCIILCAEQGLS